MVLLEFSIEFFETTFRSQGKHYLHEFDAQDASHDASCKFKIAPERAGLQGEHYFHELDAQDASGRSQPAQTARDIGGALFRLV